MRPTLKHPSRNMGREKSRPGKRKFTLDENCKMLLCTFNPDNALCQHVSRITFYPDP
jgi:hypothetical protein